MHHSITPAYEAAALDRKRQSDLREQPGELVHVQPPERPDIEANAGYQLRKFAGLLIDSRKYWLARANGQSDWRTQLNDGEEIRQLCREFAEAIESFKERALMAAERHEALAAMCTHNQGVANGSGN